MKNPAEGHIFKALPFLDEHRSSLTALVLFLFGCLAVILRVWPVFTVQGDILGHVETGDSLYLLRQVELMLPGFPSYQTYDPMTFFPYGTYVNWGPLFASIITFCCLVSGAVTRQEIVSVAVLVPPLLAALLVPLTYLIGKSLGEWLCGMTAALFIAVMPGNFFATSSFGVIDHHVAEALFGCAFVLCYLSALCSASNLHKNPSQARNTCRVLILSLICGAVYVAGYLTMPTFIIFAFLVAVFTVIQSVLDFHARRDFLYLVGINACVFGCALLGSLFYLRVPQSFLLTFYSMGHPLAFMLIILGTGGLYLISRVLEKKPVILYPVVLLVLAGGAVIVSAFAVPSLYNTAVNGLMEAFGQKVFAVTVVEARPLGFSDLLSTYQFGLFLLLGGLLILAVRVWKARYPPDLLCLSWGVLLLVMSLMHGRYEYLLGAPFAVISALAVSWAAGFQIVGKQSAAGGEKKHSTSGPAGLVKRKRHDGRPAQRGRLHYETWKESLSIIGIVLGACFVGTAIWSDLHLSPPAPPAGWPGAMDWLQSNTPDTGVGYNVSYSEDRFSYPSRAYGIMSWWDYGHMITFLAHRIPNTNPFQEGLRGKYGAPAFLLARDEKTATHVLEKDGSRYVITDFDLVSSKFWAIATYQDPVNVTSPYITFMTARVGQENGVQRPVPFLSPVFHQTMVSRLHLFDGGLQIPGEVDYVEYQSTVPETVNPPVIFIRTMQYQDLDAFMESRNTSPTRGVQSGLFSRDYVNSTAEVPALTRFRLVYESPETAYASSGRDIRQVKIFEFVKGARINGSGVIQVPLETNAGRRFTYTQESSNGGFIVPYATEASNGGVRTLGPYILLNQSVSYRVAESDIQNGLTVNAAG
jgi:dolichyl-diphosphooligosaccharide--protein glycosyltransferase